VTELRDLSARELRDAIAGGKASAAEAARAYLDAIAAGDGDLHAYNELYPERALERAAAVDADRAAGRELGALAGVPVAIKDNLCTAWGRTTCASRYLAEFRAPYTATAVAKLEAAGAVVLGKTNMDEFAMGSSTEHSAVAPTRNPWDRGRVPGGSSGGSAAAVSVGLAAAAVGSDTGGSIRQPAAFCGVVGLKPTYGRVSRYGLVAFASSLDQIGPLARDATDCALLTGVLAGHDKRDSTSLPEPAADYLAEIDTPLAPLRVGRPGEFFSEALGGEVRAAVEKALETYRSLGAEIVDVELPHSRIDIDAAGRPSSYAVACYYILCMAEASSNLARYDGVHYGHRTSEKVGDIVEMFSRSRAESLGPEVKRRIMLGTYTLSAGYYDAYYDRASRVRRLIAEDFARAFERCDVILAPVTPTPAFRLGEKTDDPLAMYLTDIYTSSLNLAGLPGLALPAGISEAGLPIGMQLIGPVCSEARLFRAARMFEQATGLTRLQPPGNGGGQ